MSLNGSLHVNATDRIELVVHAEGDWLYIGSYGVFPVFCDDAATADRVAEAFAQLAKNMRKRAQLPEPDLFEGPRFPDSLEYVG